MISKYQSIHHNLANQELDWLPNDTKEWYAHNLKYNYQQLADNGWINTHFKYAFNSHGFRCQEFTPDPSIMFLGCSFTFGIGLPVDVIWPELTAQGLNMRCANLGIGGSDLNTAFRLASGWIDRVRPKIVVLMIPSILRFELITDRIIQILPNDVHQQVRPFYATWCQNTYNTELNAEKSILAIHMLCHLRHIKFLRYEWQELNHSEHRSALARDLRHWGAIQHELFSQKVLADIGK